MAGDQGIQSKNTIFSDIFYQKCLPENTRSLTDLSFCFFRIIYKDDCEDQFTALRYQCVNTSSEEYIFKCDDLNYFHLLNTVSHDIIRFASNIKYNFKSSLDEC